MEAVTMISKIRDFVYNECQKKENLFNKAFFEEHILIVKDYALELAKQTGGDPEIIEMSSYLHDISAIQNFSSIPDHNNLGAGIARNILMQYDYPEEKIKKIEKCIISHKSPVKINYGTTEEICLSNADAMSQISKLVYWSFYTFNVHKYPLKEGRESLINRMKKNWNNLIKPAQDIIKDIYYENMMILKNR
jgi:uncharacterized protein